MLLDRETEAMDSALKRVRSESDARAFGHRRGHSAASTSGADEIPGMMAGPCPLDMQLAAAQANCCASALSTSRAAPTNAIISPRVSVRTHR